MSRVLCMALGVLLAGPLPAQQRRWSVSTSVLLYVFTHVADTGGGGPDEGAFGGEGQVRFGSVSLTLRGIDGGLIDPDLGDQDFRVTTASLGLHPASWLTLGARVEAQRYKRHVPDMETFWKLSGPFVLLSGSLGLEGLRATFNGAWFVQQQVGSTTSAARLLRDATTVEAGLKYDFRLPLTARVAYRLEIYRFEQGPATRRGGILAGIAVRFLGAAP